MRDPGLGNPDEHGEIADAQRLSYQRIEYASPRRIGQRLKCLDKQ
jgi:hypothetical protein